jgi:hypothetical protein
MSLPVQMTAERGKYRVFFTTSAFRLVFLIRIAHAAVSHLVE